MKLRTSSGDMVALPPMILSTSSLKKEGPKWNHHTLLILFLPFLSRVYHVILSQFCINFCRYGQKDHWRKQCKMLLSHGRWSWHTRSACRTSRPLSLKSLSSLLMVSCWMIQICLGCIFFNKRFDSYFAFMNYNWLLSTLDKNYFNFGGIHIFIIFLFLLLISLGYMFSNRWFRKEKKNFISVMNNCCMVTSSILL